MPGRTAADLQGKWCLGGVASRLLRLFWRQESDQCLSTETNLAVRAGYEFATRKGLRMQTDNYSDSNGCPARPTFEEVVERHYRTLYQFAISLTGSENDARDLTQQTFYTWSLKGAQLRDVSKVKAWLFTTLHRSFLQARRRETRFPHYELSQVDGELPTISPRRESQSDCQQVLEALEAINENFRAPLALFYLEDYPYKDIAQILNMPLGTVKSRIARGLDQLQKLLVPAESYPAVSCAG